MDGAEGEARWVGGWGWGVEGRLEGGEGGSRRDAAGGEGGEVVASHIQNP